jgi:hypothetical protein
VGTRRVEFLIENLILKPRSTTGFFDFISMKLISTRVSFSSKNDITTIVILPEKNVWVNAMMGMWLAMWWVIGCVLLWSLFNLKLNEQEKLIIYIFFVFWAYYAFKVTKSFLWLLYGKELLKIDEVGISLKKSLLTFGQASPFYFENIKSISYSIPASGSFQAVWEASPWVTDGERITFEYFEKPIRFGRKLNEKESAEIVNIINKKIKSKK